MSASFSRHWPCLIFTSLAFSVFCCSDKGSAEPPIPARSPDMDEITYEGRVLLDTATYLEIVVKLNASTDTEGQYLLSETVTRQNQSMNNSSVNGFYNISGDNSGRPLLILQNSGREVPLRRRSVTGTGRIREENFRNTDLKFYMLSDALQVLDNEEIVSSDPEYFLYKKTSPTFTVEGYFMYRGDTSLFYEMNTHQHWPVTKLGVYHQAAWEHNTLAVRKNDTTYLKATAYSIQVITKSRRPVEALVLKKILQSSSR